MADHEIKILIRSMVLDVLKYVHKKVYICHPALSVCVLFFVAKTIEKQSHILKTEAGSIFQNILPHSVEVHIWWEVCCSYQHHT
jgi:hypothetical protein